MTPTRHASVRAARRGFTLIELIGVLAIIAIIASVLAPNMVRSLDRAAVRAEDETLARLGEQLVLHLRDKRAVPSEATWGVDLAAYSDIAVVDIRTNKRANPRLLVYETATNPERALILSSMRPGRTIPATAGATRPSFQTIWDNKDEEVPFLLNWGGWRRQFDANNNVIWTDGDYLVVERVNLRPILRDELQPRTISLNNTSSGTAARRVSYRLNGAGLGTINAGESRDLPGMVVGDRLDLFGDDAGVSLNYTYIVGAGGRIRTIDFDGTQWTPR